ncbi:MAG: UDP-N-acetylmuramate--L-alanine ligase [Flavobacteriales bacterium]|nr:UDP-N-acetylmuramate--L-alanine ligase [Flavobacteriales bacterium]
MKWTNFNNVYLVGIGGIGMSALAKYFLHMGKKVAGYDRTATTMTSTLEQMGIEITFDKEVNQIPENFKKKDDCLVIYTPAIPKDHPQLMYFLNNSFEVHKRSVVLGMITAEHKTLAIAGTHGKTTTSTILAHILYQSDMGCNAFLGGVSANYNSNFLFHSENAVTVVEADEFDRSFLTLHPHLSAITSMDADHLDIYSDKDDLGKTFEEFASQTAKDGHVYLAEGLSLPGQDTLSYGFGDDCFAIAKVESQGAKQILNFKIGNQHISDISFPMPGKHNAMNALVASTMALEAGAQTEEIKRGLESFRGIKRRFEYHFNDDIIYIDDYAHHPTELAAAIETVKEHHPGKKVTGVFQPHLFSRTRDFIDGFAESLSQLDEIILLPIYPAREKPIEGVDSQWLLDKISNPNKKLINKSRLLEDLDVTSLEVLITLGAGDIDTLVQPITEHLKKSTSAL